MISRTVQCTNGCSRLSTLHHHKKTCCDHGGRTQNELPDITCRNAEFWWAATLTGLLILCGCNLSCPHFSRCLRFIPLFHISSTSKSVPCSAIQTQSSNHLAAGISAPPESTRWSLGGQRSHNASQCVTMHCTPQCIRSVTLVPTGGAKSAGGYALRVSYPIGFESLSTYMHGPRTLSPVLESAIPLLTTPVHHIYIF